MLNHLRQRIAATLARVRRATLATCGPAGLQAQVVPCAARGTTLYLLLPATSDQLVNLEHTPAVAVATNGWQIVGQGRVLPPEETGPGRLLRQPDASWCVLVAVQPARVSIARHAGWGPAETIDLE